MSALPKRKYTIEEYVELLKTPIERLVYFDGESTSMADEKIVLSQISSNVFVTLQQRLQGSSYKVFNADLALQVLRAPLFRFPQVSVVRGTPIIERRQGIASLVNPILIVEVISDLPEECALSEKFVAYQSIESFQEYLVIAPHHAQVILYNRQASKSWLRRDVMGLDSEFQLESVNLTLSLNEVYEHTSSAINSPDEPA